MLYMLERHFLSDSAPERIAMMVFWDARLVFLATPKSGSTAIAAALSGYATLSIQEPPVLKHMTLKDYRRSLGRLILERTGAQFETVALMREPIDWLGSWYRYRRRDELSGEANSTAAVDFDAFLAAYLADPQPPFAQVGAQSRFLVPDGPFAPVDRIFRYEAMPLFLDFISARLGVEVSLPRLNVSPAMELDLSPRTRARVEQGMARDFALYASLG
jgi:hypothetical protein